MNILTQIIASTGALFYELAKLGATTIIPGATGKSKRQRILDAISAGKSKAVMRKQWGAQPEHHKSRRILRQELRFNKRKNSYCNNLDADGNVIKN